MRHRALLASTIFFSTSHVALAQSVRPSLDLRGFHAPTDPNAGLYLELAEAPATLDWNAGLWLSYAYRPVTLRPVDTGKIAYDIISHQVTSDLTASVGIARRLALGFDLPVLIVQGGDDLEPSVQKLVSDAKPPGQALGDLGLNTKFTLLRPTSDEFGGFALAINERFTLPTGSEASYLGEGSVTSETRFLVEYRLLAIGVHAAAGLKLRGSEERFACASTLSDETCPSRFGHEIPFGLGFAVKPQLFGVDKAGRITVYLEGHGYLPLSPIGPFESTAASSLQGSLSARYALRDFSFFLGVETALIGGIGDARFRGVMAVGWAPRRHDADGDGIDDDVDQCRELPEDKDGFDDSDGCPDADNDSDGVPDPSDKCPRDQEDEDGFRDDDGCPDLDNDGDNISDDQDACPNVAGRESTDPKKNGCPSGAEERSRGSEPKEPTPSKP